MHSTSKYLIVSRLCQLAVDKCRQHVERLLVAQIGSTAFFWGSMFWLIEIFIHGSLNSTRLFGSFWYSAITQVKLPWEDSVGEGFIRIISHSDTFSRTANSGTRCR